MALLLTSFTAGFLTATIIYLAHRRHRIEHDWIQQRLAPYTVKEHH